MTVEENTGASQQTASSSLMGQNSSYTDNNNALTINTLTTLTKQEIERTVSANRTLSIPSNYRKTKDLFMQFIIQYAPPSLREALLIQIQAKSTDSHTSSLGKRHWSETGQNSCKTARIDEDISAQAGAKAEGGGENEETTLPGEFLEVISEEERQRRHQAFFCATSNAVVAPVICGVCAQENVLGDASSTVWRIPLQQIPNSSQLLPHTPHPSHTLIDGKLLDEAGFTTSPNDDCIVNVCQECWNELLSSAKLLPPKFSLANDMWLRKIPWQLQGLTFPEQLLLAQLYPCVYVFKLFPKKVQGKHDTSTLQQGMCGNITTFELDSSGIVSMLEEDLMPRPPAILASIITVTFVGLGELPKSWLNNTFRVRRAVVAEALTCLIEKNKKYYGNFKLSPERLEALPEDGVPREIIDMICQTDDAAVVDEEGAASYLPTEEDSESIFRASVYLVLNRH